MMDLRRGSALRSEIKRSGKVKHIINHKQSNICFLLTDTETIFTTGFQTFILRPEEVPGNLWERRLWKVREDILSRKIKDINQLYTACHKGIKTYQIDIRWYT